MEVDGRVAAVQGTRNWSPLRFRSEAQKQLDIPFPPQKCTLGPGRPGPVS